VRVLLEALSPGVEHHEAAKSGPHARRQLDLPRPAKVVDAAQGPWLRRSDSLQGGADALGVALRKRFTPWPPCCRTPVCCFLALLVPRVTRPLALLVAGLTVYVLRHRERSLDDHETVRQPV
jgi:hypothetical protein